MATAGNTIYSLKRSNINKYLHVFLLRAKMIAVNGCRLSVDCARPVGQSPARICG